MGSANLKPLSCSIVLVQPSLPPEAATTSSARVLESWKSELKRPRPCLLTKAAQILSLTAPAEGGSSPFQAEKKSTRNVSPSFCMLASDTTASAMCAGEEK